MVITKGTVSEINILAVISLRSNAGDPPPHSLGQLARCGNSHPGILRGAFSSIERLRCLTVCTERRVSLKRS
jgi:hypothetical protein